MNNLKAYQKYQNGFIFDAESNFDHIFYPVFIPLSFFSFVKK